MAKNLTKEVAIGFLDYFDFIDADEILKAAGKTRKDLINLTYDDEVAQCISIRLEAVLRTPRQITGKNAAFVSENINRFIDDIIKAQFNSVLFGYSVIENVFKRESEYLMLDKCIEKPFWWFLPSIDGNLYLNDNFSFIYGYTAIKGQKVDTTKKFILSTNGATYENPRGVALLSRLYHACHMRFHGWQFWIQFLERASAPFLVGTSVNPDDLSTELKKAVQSASIAVGLNETVSMLESSNTGESYSRLEQAIVKRIQKTILGRALTSDLDIGSRAAQEVEERVSDGKRLHDIRMAQKTVQAVCNAITLANDMEPVEFIIGDFKDLRRDRADRDKILSDSGIMRFSNSYLEREYGFLPSDFDNSQKQSESAKMSVAMAAGAVVDKEQAAIDSLALEALNEAGQPVDIGKITEIIQNSDDYESLLESLDVFYSSLGSAGKFDEAMERAIFEAFVKGYSDVYEITK